MFINPISTRSVFWSACLAVAALATLPLDTLASTALTSPKYQTECAACHIAYPPGMLPAASWHRLVGGLNKHFGVDASLDAASTTEIEDWLKAHAGSYKRANEEPPQDRISKSKWFVRQHDEVSSAVWKRKAVGSPSNCSACHANAGKGHFNEDDVRIPK
jgi:cytochrome c